MIKLWLWNTEALWDSPAVWHMLSSCLAMLEDWEWEWKVEVLFHIANPLSSRSIPQVPGLMLSLDHLAETVKEMDGSGCTVVRGKLSFSYSSCWDNVKPYEALIDKTVFAALLDIVIKLLQIERIVFLYC